MARNPVSVLTFPETPENLMCGECGERTTHLPPSLPKIGDDFVWRVRDFGQFRQFMLEELAARFPERKRVTPADIEVVIVEILAASLDALSDMSDRVFAEAYLQTARRPDSLRRLLSLIGFDAVANADALNQINVDPQADPVVSNAILERFWSQNSEAMEAARRLGPKSIRTQHRMVGSEDMIHLLSQHPFIASVKATQKWTGSWFTQTLTILYSGNLLQIDNGVHLDKLITLKAKVLDPVEKQKNILHENLTVFNENRRLDVPRSRSSDVPRLRVGLGLVQQNHKFSELQIQWITVTSTLPK